MQLPKFLFVGHFNYVVHQGRSLSCGGVIHLRVPTLDVSIVFTMIQSIQ
jgi:hypothetical protein